MLALREELRATGRKTRTFGIAHVVDVVEADAALLLELVVVGVAAFALRA